MKKLFAMLLALCMMSGLCASAETITQDDLIGIWRAKLNIGAIARVSGLSLERARSIYDNTTITFTVDQTLIMTMTTSPSTIVNDHTYELIGNQLVVDDLFSYTLTLDGDQLTMERADDGTITELTRLSREYEPVTPVTQADIEGVWNVDMLTYIMYYGYSADAASMLISENQRSITFTFTADQKYIMENRAAGTTSTYVRSYDLSRNVIRTENMGQSTLRLTDGILYMYGETSAYIMTRADADETAVNSSSTPAQPETQSNWTVPTDAEQAEEPAVPTENTTEAAPTQYVVITNSSANIRSGPDGSAAKITTAKQGDTFPLIGEDGNWYIVDVNGQTGYVTKGLSAIQ